MNRKSHIYIADYVLQHYLTHATPAQKRAFVLGCVYPDKNPFTYIKGTMRHEWLRGHNWDNAKAYLEKLCRRMETHEALNFRSAYDFGLILHYCCDAFTHAHNRSFQQGLKHHRSYERHLHGLLVQGTPEESLQPPGDVWAWIHENHSQYRASACGAMTDCRYIWNAVSQVCNGYARNLGLCQARQGNFTKKSGEICPICTCKTEMMVL